MKKIFWLWLVALLGFTLWTVFPVVYGGNTQILFNNIEQGPGSTAHPQVIVDEKGRASKSNGDAVSAGTKGGQAADSAKIESSTGSMITQIEKDLSDEEPQYEPWKFGMYVHQVGATAELTKLSKQLGGTATLGYFPLELVGVHALAGTGTRTGLFYGGEFEVIPVRLSLFGVRDMVVASAMLGGTNLGNEKNLWGTLHGGARIGVAFGKHYMLAATARTNLSDRTSFKYSMLDAGLVIRF